MDNASMKEVKQIIQTTKERAKEALETFEYASKMIRIKASKPIDIYSTSAISQVADIATETNKACDDLYATCQSLVLTIDAACRPLFQNNPDTSVLKEVLDLIKWLNDESEIKNDYTASLNGSDLGGVASKRYLPSIECKMIQSFWEGEYRARPEIAAEEFKKRKRMEGIRLAEEKKKNEMQTTIKNNKDFRKYKEDVQKECRSKVKVFKENLDCYIAQQRDLIRKDFNEIMKETRKNIQTMETEFSSLGLFKLKEKKELKSKIAELNGKIAKYSQDEAVDEKIAPFNEIADNAIKKYKKEVEQYLSLRFPSDTRITDERIKCWVISVMLQNKQVTINDLYESNSQIRAHKKVINNVKLSEIMTKLINEGYVEKIMSAGIPYFNLCNGVSLERYKEQEETENSEYANTPCPEPPHVHSVF